MKVLCTEQYDLNWWSLRRGKPTSSKADSIVTPKQLKYSASATKYIYDLVGSVWDPEYPRTDGFQSSAMKNGHEREGEARNWFSFQTNLDVHEVGLCSNERTGDDGKVVDATFWGSPDAITDETGEPVEIKNPTPGVHIKYLYENTVPAEYIAQMHGHMLVCGTKSGWFVSYCRGFPSLVIHYKATEYLSALQDSLPRFHKEYKQVYDKMYELNGEPPKLFIPKPDEEPDEGGADVVF